MTQIPVFRSPQEILEEQRLRALAIQNSQSTPEERAAGVEAFLNREQAAQNAPPRFPSFSDLEFSRECFCSE